MCISKSPPSPSVLFCDSSVKTLAQLFLKPYVALVSLKRSLALTRGTSYHPVVSRLSEQKARDIVPLGLYYLQHTFYSYFPSPILYFPSPSPFPRSYLYRSPTISIPHRPTAPLTDINPCRMCHLHFVHYIAEEECSSQPPRPSRSTHLKVVPSLQKESEVPLRAPRPMNSWLVTFSLSIYTHRTHQLTLLIVSRILFRAQKLREFKVSDPDFRAPQGIISKVSFIASLLPPSLT